MLSELLQWHVLISIVVGTLFGLVMGILPGLGSAIAVTVALPFTYHMGPVASMALVLAIYCSSVYGGSITAILINTPGTPQSAATVLDGYPMTLAGKSDLAIGYTTVASFIGGVASAGVLALLAPALANVALRFGPIQTFALICFALTCVIGVSGGQLVYRLINIDSYEQCSV